MELGGWGGCGQTAPGQPFAGQQRDELMAAADGSFCPEELEGLQAWALRVLLQRPLLQSQLRALALGGREDGSRRWGPALRFVYRSGRVRGIQSSAVGRPPVGAAPRQYSSLSTLFAARACWNWPWRPWQTRGWWCDRDMGLLLHCR